MVAIIEIFSQPKNCKFYREMDTNRKSSKKYEIDGIFSVEYNKNILKYFDNVITIFKRIFRGPAGVAASKNRFFFLA